MAGLSFRKIIFISSMFFHNHLKISKLSSKQGVCNEAQLGFLNLESLGKKTDLGNHVLLFNGERVLLRSSSSSSSLFPYFMLVAFEAGSLIRALVLLLLYPLIFLCSEDLALKAMVMVSFIGLKKERFVEGRSVLPKFFLDDVAMESFEVVRKGKMAVAISDLPQVMVETFLGNYLGIDFVVGRELKTFRGYFLGVMMEEQIKNDEVEALISNSSNKVLGIVNGSKKLCVDDYCRWFSHCKEIYSVSEEERSKWHKLPRDCYPKPLIFHDGRLAFRPTFFATLAMFTWLPMGIALGILRIAATVTLCNALRFPILHLTGIHIRVYNSKNIDSSQDRKKEKGALYVCNHRTLIDPLLLSFCLKKPLTAVVYSLSRISEILSPIKTVRLTRNRDRDAKLLQNLLSQGNVALCPEGTTCREPYLLRFSPLFTKITDRVHPVAINCHVTMFYGTTARGLKVLDPLLNLMNPWPTAWVHFLEVAHVGGSAMAIDNGSDEENSKYEMANLVQASIAKELGFTCTKLTRKDKYLILAGNEGLV
ncbi:probable glycerol-3-phosphate acyltransferase 3 [Andrographis paniculata]|uniref:probable glycerol-3-phosphate acyltransferase 3 n=1 Tax=Andrographis paniculata TaxID=175694 RepID=UPI0021E94DFB|nr:probable glycerol-3-phosphate acyltransferase 3 [Andrographis paniculata]